MATSGLSLVGFMEQSRAITYLQNVCVPNDPSPPALLAQWNDARAKSGEPFSTPGESKVEQIPDAYNAHVETFKSLPWVVPAIQQGLDVRLVGIDELLAFQFHIDLERSEALCADLPDEITLADALPKCLPIDQPQSPPMSIAVEGEHFLVIKSPSSDMRILARGPLQGQINFIGIHVGWAFPAVQVTSFNGRCYLTNGFHRVFGFRKRKLPHIPCLFREVTSFAEIGAKGGTETFDQELLESANPPTMGHFSLGRCHEVKLRKFSRIISIHYEQCFVPEE